MKDFKFLKKYGQNFLSDKNLLNAIVTDGEVDERTTVLEVGPGAGALTRAILSKCKKLVSVEIDDRLIPELEAEFGESDKFTLINKDFMKLSDSEIKELVGEDYRVVANIPYYISTSLIMRFLEGENKPKSVTVMVQKEAAERICAEVGSRESGAVTVAVNYYAESQILFGVDRKSFMPPPNVDSAVIQLKIRKTPEISLKNEESFFKFVKACFAQRRKTLVNTVSNSLCVEKDKIRSVLNALNIEETVRSEQLTMQQLCDIANLLFR